MKNFIPTFFVLALMSFTIGYGIVCFPETGLLETVAQNSSVENNPTNMTIMSEPYRVGMQTKDGTPTLTSTNATDVLPVVNAEEADIFNKQISPETSPSKKSSENSDPQPNDTTSLVTEPIVPDSPSSDSEIDGDISTPIPTNETILIANSEPAKPDESMIEEVESESTESTVPTEKDASSITDTSSTNSTTDAISTTNNEEVTQDEKSKDSFDMDELPTTNPISTSTINTEEISTTPDSLEKQPHTDTPIKQVAFEEPVQPDTDTIPRKTIPLDNNEETTTNTTLPTDSTSTTKENTVNDSTIDETASLPTLDSTNSLESPDSKPSAPPTELTDSLEFQIPESGEIPVKRFPPTDKAVEPMYNTNMDRFALEK